MKSPTIHDLLTLLARLRAAKIHYTLSDPTDGAVMVNVTVPGERWEIEVHEDGDIGVEMFVSSKGVQGPELIDDLIRRFRD